MDKKIYAIKNGPQPGIYYSWLELFEIIEQMEQVESRSFCYKEKLRDEPETVQFSFRWAVRQAQIYLGEIPGEVLDDVSDVEEILLTGVDDDASENVDENGIEDEENSEEESDIEEELDYEDEYEEEEDIFAPILPEIPDNWPFDSESELEAESEAESERPQKTESEDWNKRMHEHFGIPIRFGSAWVDLILELTCQNFDNDFKYTERYYPPKIYGFLMMLVFNPEKVLTYAYPVKRSLMSASETIREREWKECVLYEWKESEEMQELCHYVKTRLNMTELDLNDLIVRMVDSSVNHRANLRTADVEPSLVMRKFLNSRTIHLMDLYQELVTNIMYRKSLLELTRIHNNPDIEKTLQEADVDTDSLKEKLDITNRIRRELKKHLVGQDLAIDKVEKAFFHNIKNRGSRKGPENVYLFAGPPGVGKTYMAELLADAMGVPYKRFDMSGFAHPDAVEEIAGISTFWKSAKSGIVTTFVKDNPRCVLLFDEIEKACSQVIRLFLQIIDEGECLDRFYERRISFKKCTIIFTTNAGRQLYQNAEHENLTALSEKVIVDALEKDVRAENGAPFFPPELVSRLSSNTIIMFNHLRSNSIRRVILSDIEKQVKAMNSRYQLDITEGMQVVAAMAQYAVGGSKDARNASKLAGKIIDKELYELLMLIEEKAGLQGKNLPQKIICACDFTDADEEIVSFYDGQKDCEILIYMDKNEAGLQRFSRLFGGNNVTIRVTDDYEEYCRILREEEILFCVVDYTYGCGSGRSALSILDEKSEGKQAFSYLKEEYPDMPVYILADADKPYTDHEVTEFSQMGAEGFVERGRLYEDIEKFYFDVCCNRAVETLSLRHQVVTYQTRQEYDRETRTGKIIFYDLKLETAIDAEDRDTLLSEDLRPDRHWEDIYVTEDVKKELQFFIEYLQNENRYRREGVRTPKGALMYGPPGTGKTTLAKVVASESGVSFLATTGDELAAMEPARIHQLFQTARKYTPCVLFIDEVDAVGMSRTATGMNARLNALLTEMDGFAASKRETVFVMAATNLGKNIDAALVRRFDRSFLVDLPDEEGRRFLWNRLLEKQKNAFAVSETQIESLVTRSEGMSPSDIENIIETAHREGVRSRCQVDDAILDDAFEKTRYGEVNKVDSKAELRQTAVHEVGHAIMQLYNGNVPAYISVVARGDFGGYVSAEKLGAYPTKERLLQRICSCLGGRAAEQEYGYGITPGASSDLKKATELAQRMVGEWGMYEEEIGLAVIAEEDFAKDAQARQLVNRILSEQLQNARRILSEKSEETKRLLEALLSNERLYLTKKEIEEIYSGSDSASDINKGGAQ